MSSPFPALLGGQPVRPQGPPVWPIPDPEIQEAIQAAYREGSWGKYQGIYSEQVIHFLKEYHGVKHVLLCGSGTYAVELALRALKIESGSEVILAGYDYPGNFLNVHTMLAQPVLADLNWASWNLAVEAAAQAIAPDVRCILASHLHGGAVPMRELIALARTHGLAVIEDAAQMPGAVIQGKKAGTWGEVGILSFGGSKLVCAGRGGALLTNREDVFQRARTWNLRGNWVGTLSELQAAVLLPQLKKLDAMNKKRTESVQTLIDLVKDIPGLKPFHHGLEETQSGYYKVGFQFDGAAFGLRRERFVAALRAEGVAMDEGFPALHVGRSTRRFRPGSNLVECARAHEGAVILHHPVLLGSQEDLGQVAQAIKKIAEHASLLAASEQGSYHQTEIDG